MEKVNVTLNYYGNESYGKRVFWIEDTMNYIWGEDFVDWAIEQKKNGIQVVITNAHEVNKNILKQIQ